MKKIWFLNSLIIAILVWGIYSNLKFKEPVKNEIKKKINPMELDSDKDGLKDWEEKLYKTDPYNPDTDGDGVNDGEEVSKNWDPLTEGKGEKDNQVVDIRKEYGIDSLKEIEEKIKKIKEEKKRRYQEFLKAQKEREKINQKIISFEEFLQKEAREIKEGLNQMGLVVMGEQKIIGKLLKSEQRIIFHQFSVDEKFKKELENGQNKEIRKIEKPTDEDYKNWDKIIKIYQGIIGGLKGLNFKNQELKNPQNDLIEAFQEIKEGMEDLKKKDKNWYQKYTNGVKKYILVRKNLNFLIENYGIKFNDTEPGKYFVFELDR